MKGTGVEDVPRNVGHAIRGYEAARSYPGNKTTRLCELRQGESQSETQAARIRALERKWD